MGPSCAAPSRCPSHSRPWRGRGGGPSSGSGSCSRPGAATRRSSVASPLPAPEPRSRPWLSLASSSRSRHFPSFAANPSPASLETRRRPRWRLVEGNFWLSLRLGCEGQSARVGRSVKVKDPRGEKSGGALERIGKNRRIEWGTQGEKESGGPGQERVQPEKRVGVQKGAVIGRGSTGI